MGTLSLDDARSFLMGDNIKPLSVLEEPDEDASGMDELSQTSDFDSSDLTLDAEGFVYTSLHEAEKAIFEATLDAAFGPVEESVLCQGHVSLQKQVLQDAADINVDADADQGADQDVDADANAFANPNADTQAHSYNNGMVGLGVDIVEIERMRNILKRSPAFASKVFSLQEQLYCDSRSNPAAHYAMRFAAKEAVVKALGTGFSEGIGVRDIEIERTKNGRPVVVLAGAARRIADDQGILEISLSMSYTKIDAVACAMALTQAAVRETEKRKDPMKELARQFKETRKILDDL